MKAATRTLLSLWGDRTVSVYYYVKAKVESGVELDRVVKFFYYDKHVI